MKIVCQSCGAKYSIADDKIAGKSFKIRCKRCSATIVVRQDSTPPAAGSSEGPTAYDYQQQQAPAAAAGDEWHVVIEGNQQGPYSAQQVQDLIGSGKLGGEDYIWKDGFSDWQPIQSVPEFASQAPEAAASAAQPAPQASVEPAPEPDESPAETTAEVEAPPMGADPFAPAPSDPIAAAKSLESYQGGAGVANRVRRNSSADLFAPSKKSAAAAKSPAAAAQASSAGVAAAPQASGSAAGMTGQRNENSVLFSLNNLQSLANQKRKSNPPPAAQANGTDGSSGLLDIRKLATSVNDSAYQASTQGANQVDDLLSIGGGSSGLASPLTAPRIRPSTMPPQAGQRSNKLLYALVALFALVAVGAAGAVGVMVLKKSDTEQGTQALAPESGDKVDAQAGDAAENAGEANGEDSNQAVAAADSAEKDSDASAKGEERSHSSRHRRHRDRDHKSKSNDSSAAPTPAPAKAKKKAPSDMDSLLRAATSGGKSKSAPKADANLPNTPARGDVLKALTSVKGAVRACGNGQHGLAKTKVVVSGKTGRVSRAQVTGAFAGTPVASCVSKAVKRAKFPRFKQSKFEIVFPYAI